MSKFFIFIILVFLIPNITCLFDKVKFIKYSEDAVELYNKITRSKKISLLLIYSDGCPHCRNFEKDYIKLSENYNSVVNFYLLPSKSNFKKKFNIRGVPTVFFFNGKKFIEHKGLNKYDIISYILDNDYLKKCKEVNYDFLINRNNNNLLLNEKGKIEHNYIIGYFPNDNVFYNEDENADNTINKLIRKKAFNNFIDHTLKIKSLIDNCYYIRDLNNDENNKDSVLTEGTVISFSKTKGINIYTGYQDIFKDNLEQEEQYYTERINDIGEMYSKFLKEKMREHYIDITDSKMASKLKNYIKRNVLFFVYKYEEEKKQYINQISSLIAMTKNDKYPLFDYVLFKHGCDIYKISYHFKSVGIYYSDKKLNIVSKPINLDIIIEMINTQNNYEYNEKELEEIMNQNKTNGSNNTNDTEIINNTNKTNNLSNKFDHKDEQKKKELYYEKIKEQIIQHQLQTYLKNIPEERFLSAKNIKTMIFFIICLVMYSFGYDYFYKKYYPGKSIFDIFSECMDCLNLLFCYDEDDDEIDIEKRKIQVINKKRDDINEEKPKMFKVQFK